MTTTILSTSISSSVTLAAAFTVLAVFVAFLLHYYANRKTSNWYTLLTVYIAWLFPSSIVILLPLDLASNIYRQCLSSNPECKEPLLYVSETFLLYSWETIYWTSFCLTWFLIPLMNSYSNTGQFTFKGKLKAAINSNLLYYATVGVVAIAFVAYIAACHFAWNFHNLRAFLMALSNAWGLFLVVVFMGHGLTMIPRGLWTHADIHWMKGHAEFMAPKLYENFMDDDVEWNHIVKQVAYCHHHVTPESHLRELVDQLVIVCPEALSETRYEDMEGAFPEITSTTLETLHVRVKYGFRSKDKSDAKWDNLLKFAWWCDDLENKTIFSISTLNQIYQVFHTQIRFYVWRALSILCWTVSLLIIWCEVTFPFDSDTSPRVNALAIIFRRLSTFTAGTPTPLVDLFHPQSTQFDGVVSLGSVTSIQFLSVLIVGYMTYSAFSSLFRLKVFHLYSLVGKQHSDEPSLLWFGGYVCKLMFPLCYNFLNLIMDQEHTVFSRLMGQTNLIPAFGPAFHTYVPLGLAIYFFVAISNTHKWVLHKCCGIDRFFFDQGDLLEGSDEEEGTQNEHDSVARRRREGRRLIDKERRIRARRNEWSQRTQREQEESQRLLLDADDDALSSASLTPGNRDIVDGDNKSASKSFASSLSSWKRPSFFKDFKNKKNKEDHVSGDVTEESRLSLLQESDEEQYRGVDRKLFEWSNNEDCDSV